MNRIRIFLAALLMVGSLSAQRTDFPSTQCHADGTVTFQYRGDQATKVEVDVQFAGRHAMQRDAQTGLWTLTLGPAAPDMYPYCFVVDGMSVMDPRCDSYFPNEGFKNSLLEIPAQKGHLPHDIRADVPHGRIDYIQYYSQALEGVNRAIVYTPPHYDRNPNKYYPVFYLISGTTDTEEVYYKVGRMNYILDNLLSEGKAQEMIIVLPYGNPTKLLPPRSLSGGMGMGMMRDVVGEDLTGDLMRYVESHYRTLNDADHRAIGGFSRGGNQGLGIGLRHLDKFSYLCSYSSFTSTDIPGVYDNAAQTNARINLFWLGVGTDDFLYGNARDYMQFLDEHGITSVKEYTHDKYGHTWMNAKYFLYKTLPLLFNKEASRAAMAQAQPALEKTGNEQQFTPGVMARLFPRQVVSPDWSAEGVTLRLSAPEARQVLLEGEMLREALPMQRDDNGVWSITLNHGVADVCTYSYLVDGERVADPTNMQLAPQKGFKPSILENPANPYAAQRLGNLPFGAVTYDLGEGTATYTSSSSDAEPTLIIQVVPRRNDTPESWFKVGQVNLIADRYAAQTGRSVRVTTKSVPKGKNVHVLRADAYKTWAERRAAFARLLKK